MTDGDWRIENVGQRHILPPKKLAMCLVAVLCVELYMSCITHTIIGYPSI